MKHGATLLFSFILFVGDFLALVAAFTLAFIIRVKLDDRPLLEPITAEGYIAVVAVLLVFWIFVFALLGLYKPQVFQNRFKEALMLLVGSFIGILFLIGAEYVLNRAIFPARLVTVYGFVFAFLLTLLMRTIARAGRRILLKFDIGISNVLIVGSGSVAAELAERLSWRHSGYRVVGIVGDLRDKFENIPNKLRHATFLDAIQHIDPSGIGSIVQTELYADHQKNNEILSAAQEHHIAYRFVPGNDRMFVGNIDVSLFEDIPMIAVHQTALIGWGRIVKRLFDFAASALLIVLLLPIFALIYIGIKLVDYGPAIYKQKRLTRYNNAMDIYKFRSFKKSFNNMPIDKALNKVGDHKHAEAYRRGDDSVVITRLLHPLGTFLRKTSLDELPQLFNVLRGDLSLVGPRPLVPRELDNYDKKSIILSVKPGLTGLAVISGRRSIPFEERRKLDMYYVQNWSFLMDVVIILKTIVVVIRRAFSEGAD
jgi:exopolysaccharide biosynthesis polyprenyl glycosylphosphotransferase